MTIMVLILYIDMDSFFASCEIARHPELKGKPLIVGSNPPETKERGVVQACNYEARKYGIHSAMPTTMAYRLCKDAAYIEADNSYYERVSSEIEALLKGYGLRMEMDSIDEAAIEVESKGKDSALEIAKGIKNSIKNKFGLPCTVGIAKGKIIAKMACDSAKPDGLIAIDDADVNNFLQGLSVGKIPGVGKKTEEKLASLGIKTVKELAKTEPTVLVGALGSFGKELFLIANGNDMSRVVDESPAISVGREKTLEKNANSVEEMSGMISELAHSVIGEVKKKSVAFKSIGVKARYSDFTDRIKSRSLNNYSDSEEILISTAKMLFSELVGKKPIRKIGVRVSSLSQRKGQKSL
jgi:nucleotidyltransferase/DNA polymerase involved in DNA repair